MKKKRPKKICCEICNNDNKAVLHLHHIIERTELNTNNNETNLLCLCPTCHAKIHAKQINIVGLFDSTKLPYKRTVVYIENNICSIPGMENEKSYYELKPQSMKI